MIQITSHLTIPEDELVFTASGSSGPGGQHVNKTSTRITLWFNVADSPTLTDAQKARIRQRLATRINKNGVLRVSSQRHRSQSANREQAVERFAELIREALAESPRRKKTRTPKKAREKRLAAKKHVSRKKKLRKVDTEA